MKVVLKKGEYVEVGLEGTDGTFRIVYGTTQVDVRAGLPDTEGRVGLIYREKFGGFSKVARPKDTVQEPPAKEPRSDIPF